MTTKHQQDSGNKDASLTRPRKHFTVSASPLNAVKLDLAIILLAAVIVLVVVSYVVSSYTLQLLYLLGFGLLAMLWLIIRARRVLQQQMDKEANET